MGAAMNELALFAGAGGGILGGKLLGWRTVCAVEVDAYCASVLAARQNDGHLEPFPIWDDVRTFDGRPWRGAVDVVSGGFPCQDISSAGKRAGITGERSGLWREFARIIGEVRPAYAFIENSPHLRTRGLEVVLGDLARLGYDARWGVVGADAAGAPHIRKRMWIRASDANMRGKRAIAIDEKMASASSVRHADGKAVRQSEGGTNRAAPLGVRARGWWPAPGNARMDDGLAHKLDRVRATGNGQVAAVVPLAWDLLEPRDD